MFPFKVSYELVKKTTMDQLNKVNIAKVLCVPILYFLLKDYPVLQAFLIGLSTMDLYREVEKYGLKSILLKPDPEIVRRVFSLVEAGDLDELKRVTKSIPPRDLVQMTQRGMQFSLLIKAVDSERRDIVRWLITEKGAPVNQVCKHETALLRAIYRNNELIVKDLLEFGADMEHRREVVNWNMPIEAVMR